MKPGEFVFLTGPSGAGKTTLLRLLSMEEPPTVGEARIGEFSTRTIRRREVPRLRRKIGLVFQDFRLLPDRSAFENIALVLRVIGSPRAQIHRRVMRSLAAVGLSGRGDALPGELSAGERQRVGIARAIVNDPLVVLADEPTGNVDRDTTREIFALLQKVSDAGTSVLVATHDAAMVAAIDARTLALDSGRLVSDTPPGSAVAAIARPVATPGPGHSPRSFA
jgi:cell division transport system ATP-binding protein